jgi:phenylalanyl-tRNA synthetase beta chain
MKISLAWLLDHIQVSKQRDELTISALMERFNQVTAEIEGFHKIELPLERISVAQVIASSPTGVTVRSTEWQGEYQLSARTDIAVGDCVLVYQDRSLDGKPRWVTLEDVGSEKEGLMPAVLVAEHELAGGWKNSVEKTDYVLDVDNKSLTHRPDMWGHRGFAREVAALFNLSLRPLQDFMPDINTDNSSDINSTGSRESQEIKVNAGQERITCKVEDPGCDRFAGLLVPDIENRPSLLWMALRLARVDTRPMLALVDFTNYVMLDISQPMHAFDADKLQAKELIVRKARNKEQLELLDGTTIELTSDDLVVCDGVIPVSLGGIMGGRSTCVSNSTKALFLESAHWDPTTIRLTAARHKKRTDAAVRYEKNVDPYQNVLAITRYVKLCQDAHISYTLTSSLESALISLGAQAKIREIEVSHAFIEQRLGVSLDPEFVIGTLQKLEFGVERISASESAGSAQTQSYCEQAGGSGICFVPENCSSKSYGTYGAELYRVHVPTFRATKDIEIPEDIVEEVGRFYGYSQIPLVLPAFKLEAKDMSALVRMRAIKRLLADGCAMRELYTYAFFDEAFLRRIQWEPKETLSVQYAVSENW